MNTLLPVGMSAVAYLLLFMTGRCGGASCAAFRLMAAQTRLAAQESNSGVSLLLFKRQLDPVHAHLKLQPLGGPGQLEHHPTLIL